MITAIYCAFAEDNIGTCFDH